MSGHVWLGLTAAFRFEGGMTPGVFTLRTAPSPPSLLLFVSAEYVNAQELPTDMKSITDRAAQTLLWTELFRGQREKTKWH